MMKKRQRDLRPPLVAISALILALSTVTIQQVWLTKAIALTDIPTNTPFPWDDDLLPAFRAMQADQDCVFPCWWGLEPGETTANELLNFLRETGFERKWLGPLELGGANERATGGVELYFREGVFHAAFTVENNVLDRIRLEFGNPGQWLPQDVNVALPTMLGEMDATPEIFEPSRGRRIPRWVLLLLYREQGVLAEYTFRLRQDQVSERLDPFILCLNLDRTTYIRFWLQSPNDDHPITDYLPGIENSIEIWSQNPNSERALITPYYPFDAPGAFDFETESFTQFFIENPDDCLEVHRRQVTP